MPARFRLGSGEEDPGTSRVGPGDPSGRWHRDLGGCDTTAGPAARPHRRCVNRDWQYSGSRAISGAEDRRIRVLLPYQRRHVRPIMSVSQEERRTGTRMLSTTRADNDRVHWCCSRPGDVRIMKRVTSDALTSADISRKATPSSRRDLHRRGPGRLRHRSEAGQPGHLRIADQPGRACIPARHPGC